MDSFEGGRSFLLNALRISWDDPGTQMVLVAMTDTTAHKEDVERAKLLAKEQAAEGRTDRGTPLKPVRCPNH
jgi:hypothetical protein